MKETWEVIKEFKYLLIYGVSVILIGSYVIVRYCC